MSVKSPGNMIYRMLFEGDTDNNYGYTTKPSKGLEASESLSVLYVKTIFNLDSLKSRLKAQTDTLIIRPSTVYRRSS